MTRHLSDDALLRTVEAGESHAHLEQCEACRQLAEELREALAATRADEVPEPSPLFWDHFSARVRDGVAASEDAPRVGAGAGRIMRRFAYVTLALLLVAGAAWRIQSTRRGEQVASARARTVRPVAVARDTAPDAEERASEDASWDLVTDSASTVDLDTATQAAGVSLQPGTADRAALQLSADEQRELVRLLQAAVTQPE